MNSYSRKWNTPYESLIVTVVAFQKCNLDLKYAIKFCLKLGKKCHAMKARSIVMTYRPRDRVPSGGMLALPDPRRPDKVNPPKVFDDPFFNSTGMIYMHWVPTGLRVHKEYYVEVLREFRNEIPRKRPALFKSGQWYFHQDNALVYNSILVTDYLTKMCIKTLPHSPYSPDLASCDFWLFPKLRGCRYETIKDIKEAVTKVIDTLTQEDFHGTYQGFVERYNNYIVAGGDYFEAD